MNWKKFISVIMCFVVLTLCFYTGSSALGEEKTYSGTVNVNSGSYLTLRKEPDAKSDELGRLNRNDSVVIHGDKVSGINGDTRKWYKIEHEAASGGFAYVAAEYITNVTEIIPPAEYVPDATFEENLEKQGFPESYKVLLRQLHATHPKWIFLADHINLTWDEVLAAESAVGKSLVSISRPDSYKSMEYGAYDWGKSNYVGFDGSSWVTAYRDIVAYYLEPRNFLNEQGIYQFLDQSYNEALQNKDGINKIIENSFMSGDFPEDTFETYADLLMSAGKTSKVSPYVLAAMIIQEQGRSGTSGLISGTYGSGLSGYYNHFNIGAHSEGSLTAVQRGLMYARGDFASATSKTKYQLPWTSRAKSIIGGAIWYGSGYIDVGQDTLYYKKFDLIGPNYYNHQYMTNIEAAYKESIIMKEAYADIADTTALTFSIPVFKNMPEENKTALPTSNGANNYYLTDITVEGQSITPSFGMYTNSYEMVVDYNVAKIKVSATPVSGATVSGTGEHELKVGENTVTLTVKAASGKTADYTISVVRKEGQGEIIIPEPEVTTDYTVGTYLTGISPETTVEAFKKAFTVKNGTLKIFNSAGKEKTSGNIATGDKITVYKSDNTEFLVKTVVIYGDINGNGKIDSIDLIRLQKKLINLSDITGVYSVAADVNRDNKLTSVDLIRIQKHLIKLITIEQ